MRFSICNEIFEGWDFARTCAFARKAGYDGVELAPFTFAPRVTDISAATRREILRTAEGEGVAVAGIHWVLARTTGFHVNHPDAAVRERTSNYLEALVDFCVDVGGRVMVFGSPAARQVMEGVTRAEAEAWTLETFAAAARRAETSNATICLEPLSTAETNFLTSAAEAAALARRAKSSAVGIMLDVKALCSEGRPPEETIRSIGGGFRHFHANDPNLKGPGFGETRFAPIASALRDVGYSGWVSVEVFRFDEGPETIAAQSRENLRAAFGE